MLLVTGLCKSKGFEGEEAAVQNGLLSNEQWRNASVGLKYICHNFVFIKFRVVLYLDCGQILTQSKLTTSNSKVISTTMKSSTWIDPVVAILSNFLSEKVSVHTD